VAGDEHTGVGCWNWETYRDDKYFDTRESIQLGTVMNIIDDIDSTIKSSTMLERQTGPPDAADHPEFEFEEQFGGTGKFIQ
jgi:hypothetical protein